MSTDPDTETERELLDRVVPGWGIKHVGQSVRVERLGFHSHEFEVANHAIQSAAVELRAIIARDRATRVEAEPETPRLRRVPVQMATVVSGNEIYVVTLANDGTMWETDFPMHECKWCRGSPLPQPGEDGGA